MKTSIEVKDLKKSFGKVKVLKGVNFKVNEGQILAILGPNGAGKTTTINILSTLLNQDSGTASIAGFDTLTDGDEVRASIGLTGQFAAVDEYLTGRENIQMIGRLYHLPEADISPRVDELVKKFDLVDAADRPARTYSGGMKRRLDLAMSLVADPPVLFLDEPTTGLDPRSRLALWGMIRELASAGRTILLTTQYMEEADYLANNIIVIDHGTVIAEGTPSQLKTKAGADQIEVSFKTAEELRKALEVFKGKKAVSDENDLTIHLSARKGLDSLKEALDALDKAKVKAATASLRRPTLDDVFLALTGRATAEDEKEAK